MFNDKLKQDVGILQDQVKFLDTRLSDTIYKRIADLEENFQLLLDALNMERREEFSVPSRIVKRPEPVCDTICPKSAWPPPHESYQDGTATYAQGAPAPVKAAKRRKKSKGKR